jgi:transposase
MAGRPTLLTPERADDLVLLLAAGASPARAAAAVGVGERSVTRWLRDGLRERVIEARAASPETAEALSEARLVVLIARAAVHDWKAAAWLLERRYPERWARRREADDG